MFTDTHCHIHESEYSLPTEDVLSRAREAGVDKLLCVGTDEATSRESVEFTRYRENMWSSVGLHPHDAKNGINAIGSLKTLFNDEVYKIVAIGECGLDYFYTNSPREQQIAVLEAQLQLALDHTLPLIFHVRDAFDDFWPILKNFSAIKGVLHSFTDTMSNLERGLSEGLYIGVNGISTFTKDVSQQAVFDAIPLEKMLLETDAPFLTPVPHRGKVNEPAFVRNVAEYHVERRREAGVELEHLARVTSTNASTLFSI
jgi:TatD DNase family protein